jgi:AcrR family transcriptional regulator
VSFAAIDARCAARYPGGMVSNLSLDRIHEHERSQMRYRLDMANVEQLPRGRHRLTREEVLASQRGRMLTAMVEAVAEKGLARVTVKDVLLGAGVSRETFYEHFDNKDDCFFEAYDGASQIVQGAIGGAWSDASTDDVTGLQRLDRSLGAYLGAMASEPLAARVFMIDILAAGPEAVARRYETLEAFTKLIASLVDAQTPTELTRAEAFVGAVSSMVSARLAAGRADELPALREPLLDLAQALWP